MMGSGGGGGLGRSSSTGGATQQNLQQMGGAAEAASPISSIPPAAMPHNFSMSTSTSTGGGGGSNYNFDEDMLMGGGASGDMNELGDVGGGGGGGGGGGNRWPRQETLALIKIRSEMDVAFRDATLKGPLWDHVSRKLGELGYKRSAKKCKEKFENVHKYYKRTKEGRAGRQDGKSYRFFTELEALHGTNIPTAFSSGPAVAAVSTTTSLQPDADPIPVSVGFGQLMPPVISSTVQVQAPPVPPPRVGASVPSDSSTAPALVFTAPAAATAPLQYVSPAIFGVSFSSEGTSSSSYSSDSEEDDDNPTDLGGGVDRREPAAHDPAVRHQHKRKRSYSLKGPHQHLHSSSKTNRERMMEFFEGLMKQVMQKQEAMQQRFLEAIEKREQDRMIREEAWKRQEMARLAREHELLSQERAVSASRDAAIVSFLQKITGQTIQLPPPATNPAASAAAVPVYRPPPSPPQPPPSSQQYHKLQQPAQNYFPQQQEHQPQRSQQIEQLSHQPQQRDTQIAATTEKNQPSAPISSSLEIIVAVPNQGLPTQEIGSTAVAASVEATSSRWPKTEVLALIKLRSTLEPRYQEAGPKGPLWEEISAGMHRMGYKRSSKRCKEKWENINKYFKKVKESNKQRPEDAKTCPYFHELDALYQKKILGSGSSTATGVNTIVTGDQVQQQQQVKEKGMRIDTKFQDQGQVPTAMAPIQTKLTARSETKDGSSNDLQITKGGFTASLFGEGSDDTGVAEGAKKPESIVKEQQPQNHHLQLMMNEYGDTEKLDDDNLQQEDDEYNDDDELDEDDEAEEETKMAYTIQFQRQNTGSSNGGGTGAPSFLAMVQ